LTCAAKSSFIAVIFPKRQEVAVNKSELVDAVATAAGLDKRQAEAAVGAFVASVVSTAKSGEAVSIFGFGTFKPTARAARTGRNPQTGAPVKIAASKGVKFQPATAFKSALNAKKSAAKKVAAKKAAPAPAKGATAKRASTTATAKKASAQSATTAKKSPAKKAPAKAASSAKKR
jgi:nucleoid DNA-binding protein